MNLLFFYSRAMNYLVSFIDITSDLELNPAESNVLTSSHNALHLFHEQVMKLPTVF